MGCTWYVLGTYWHILGKKKKKNAHNVGIRPVDLMHSILRAIPLRYERSSMVISLVNTRYIFSKTYTGVAQYLLAGVGP